MSDRFQTFEEFWPYYVREHSMKATRVLHFVGTTLAASTLAMAVIKRRPALVPLALVAGYGPAWFSHFFIEKNRPATFTYPLWSLLADFRMWGKTAAGTMDEEVRKAAATSTRVVSAPGEQEGTNEAGSNGAAGNGAVNGSHPGGVNTQYS